jgi:anti-anti-sigma factor
VRPLANLTVGEGADHVVIASMAGEIDLSNVAELTASLLHAVPNEASGLLLEMTDVVYIDSSGIRMLIDLARRLGWRSQELVIVAPEGSRTRTVLSTTGVEGSLRLERSLEAARAASASERLDEPGLP